MAALYVEHPSSYEHDTGSHPENAGRLRAIEAAIAEADGLSLERAEAPAAEREQLERVHTAAHIDAIRELSEAGGGMIDLDTSASAGSYEAALHAAGGAAWAARTMLTDGHRAAFCGLRPPGHHAERARAMGFCLFNNVAVAARFARRELGLARVAILDWDVHHCNGTQDTFWDDPSVYVASLHQWPFYPGTGGPGEGNETTLNIPFDAGAGDEPVVEAMERVVAPALEAFEPDLLLVSAGFDGARGDPIGELDLTAEGFAALALRAGTISKRVAFVLEGGYNTQTLAGLVGSVLAAS